MRGGCTNLPLITVSLLYHDTIDDALFESGSVYWFMLFFFIASELVSKG